MSAIDHSKIESANDPETRAIDYEASRIARQAAEALRQSRRVSLVMLPLIPGLHAHGRRQLVALLHSAFLHMCILGYTST